MFNLNLILNMSDSKQILKAISGSKYAKSYSQEYSVHSEIYEAIYNKINIGPKYNKAKDYYDNGDYESAVKEFVEVINTLLEFSEQQLNLKDLANQAKNYDEIQNVFEKLGLEYPYEKPIF